MIKLNAAQENKAQSLILDLGIRARMFTNTRAEGYSSSSYGPSLLSDRYERISSAAAKTIMQAVTRRSFNFEEVDRALTQLKDYGFTFGDNTSSPECSWSIKNIGGAAKFLAWVCARNKIYWNDIAYTPAEREDWKAKSVFASCLWDAECFVSQPTTMPKAKGAASLDPTARGSRAASGTGAPKSSYKTAGPQSSYVQGLVGKPGEKISVSESILFCIVGDKAGTIVPKAFVHPVENPAVGERAKFKSAGLPIVKFGAGNGYTDLAIYSTTPGIMENILKNLTASGALDKYSGVHVARARNDASGYFKINTEHGEVLVKPTKLNEHYFMEALEEEAPIEEAFTAETEGPSTPAIVNMEAFRSFSNRYD